MDGDAKKKSPVGSIFTLLCVYIVCGLVSTASPYGLEGPICCGNVEFLAVIVALTFELLLRVSRRGDFTRWTIRIIMLTVLVSLSAFSKVPFMDTIAKNCYHDIFCTVPPKGVTELHSKYIYAGLLDGPGLEMDFLADQTAQQEFFSLPGMELENVETGYLASGKQSWFANQIMDSTPWNNTAIQKTFRVYRYFDRSRARPNTSPGSTRT